MIKKILKKLEKIKERKDKIKFLVKELKKTKDKKLKTQIEAIIDQLVEEENLEERIELKQPLQGRQERTFRLQTLEEQLPKIVTRRGGAEPEKVDYKIKKGTNYETIDSLETSTDPTKKDISSELNLAPTKVEEIYESQSAQDDPKYTNQKQNREEMEALQTERLETQQSLTTQDILKRKKPKEIEVKYEPV